MVSSEVQYIPFGAEFSPLPPSAPLQKYVTFLLIGFQARNQESCQHYHCLFIPSMFIPLGEEFSLLPPVSLQSISLFFVDWF